MQYQANKIKFSSELRQSARDSLRGNWWLCVLLCVVFTIISGLPNYVPAIGSIISILIAGPLGLSLAGCFMKLIRKENVQFENLFDGFSNFKTSMLLSILMSILIFLWSLLLIVPGIIAALSYSMSYYILNDNPTMTAKEALNESKRMMYGHKGRLFCLYLSFIGWMLLTILTLGLGMLWVTPYIQASVAHFYQNLKEATAPIIPNMQL